MGIVLTGRPCALTAAPAAPVRVPTIAKWKVVKKKVKLRPRKVPSCAQSVHVCASSDLARLVRLSG